MVKRVDFTTTTERHTWLKQTAARQEISVSQLINRLIRNRMKNEEKFIKKTTNYEEPKGLESQISKVLSKAEILAKLDEADETNEQNNEEDLPF